MKTTELAKVRVTRKNPHGLSLWQWEPARQREPGNQTGTTSD